MGGVEPVWQQEQVALERRTYARLLYIICKLLESQG